MKKKDKRSWLTYIAGLTVSAGFLLVASIAVSHAIDMLSAPPDPGFAVASIGDESVEAQEKGGNVQPVALYREQLIDNGEQPSVHAATLVNLPDGDVGAFWFGGSREGGGDVEIWFARYDQQTGNFSPARSVMSRQLLASQLGRYIRKLGNPAAILDGNGQVWLFFVSVSAGGWATSSINFIMSTDGGVTWSPARRLVTSPFFNVSTLVRNPPVNLTDGGLAIPIYHELAGKFAEILFVTADGDIRQKVRVTWGRDALQPSLVPISESHAAVFMRYAGDPPMRMLFATTGDAGRTFDQPRSLDLPNADNSVAATRRGTEFWIVYNSSETGRGELSVAIHEDARRVARIYDLESGEGGGGGEFSYPAIITDFRGRHHVAYTHKRQHIKHVVFNDVWLTQVRNTYPAELSP
ncbi:MAG: exo-alpha-sialidase [Roseovarius sp.]|nr:exo-alpha-sialidase [Roseovarius sp.]